MEVLGAVASGLAVGQAAKVVIKVKRMWNEVQDVPDRIQSLLDYLDALGPLLGQIESEFSQSMVPDEIRHSVSIRQSIAVCQRAIAVLHELAFEMEKEINRTRPVKKKIVCAKIALKKDVVQRLEKKLEMTINLFNVSVAHYNMAMQNITYQAVRTLVQRSTSTVHMVLEEEDDGVNEQLKGLAFIRKGCGATHLRSKTYSPTLFPRIWWESAPDGTCRHWFFQPPSWLSMRVWETEWRTACSGWQQFATYRCYNVRPANSKVFKCITDGRTDDLLSLFQMREASPFDRDHKGRSLLYYAAFHNNLKVCRTLLTLGLDVCLDERYGEIELALTDSSAGGVCMDDLTPRELTGQWNLPRYESSSHPEYLRHLEEKIAIMDLFRRVEYYHSSASDTVQLLSKGLTRRTNWKADVLMHFQQRLAPSYYQLPLKTRLQAVRNVVQNAWDETEADYPDLLRVLLKEDRLITREDVFISIQEKISLIHTAAMGFAISRSMGYPWRGWNVSASEERSAAWLRFATDVIAATTADDLNTIETIQPLYGEEYEGTAGCVATPLLALLYAASGKISTGTTWRSHLRHDCMGAWLEFLKACNIDLEEYGKREQQTYHYLRSKRRQQFRCVVNDADAMWKGDRDLPKLLLELREIEYGLDQEDWNLRWKVERIVNEVYQAADVREVHEVHEVKEADKSGQGEQADTSYPGDMRDREEVNIRTQMPGSWVD
ncbi:hypothetical protein B0H66DRAFT_553201 [Apodospora peruviana]|uniref:Uncharacterized protein n=1 Tax=Apodospora peruviana TaxID=516989 RepID=A0AAE0IC98_9PEZI|nr:hypothetical protein B0H66DRAFT_553201 [Apodospora peruviana]